jgi:xanthine dehydrogenase small subunit
MQPSSANTLPLPQSRDHLVVFLNGERHAVASSDTGLTLAEWLRLRLGKVGTKIVCNEGDCGACSVLLGSLSPSTNAEVAATRPPSSIEYCAIDSCIAFMFQLDGKHIVTVEGLGLDGMLSPVQEAMVKCHGSQCGFCTPGFVTTMHGLIESGDPLSDESLRYGLSGNLCRCTGYVQILEAGKSIDARSVAKIGELYPDIALGEAIQNLQSVDVHVRSGDHTIYLPRTLEQALEFRASHPTATIVSGATDYGVLHNHGGVAANDVLCLTHLEELQEIGLVDDMLSIGALARWIDVEASVRTLLPEYYEILTRFGSPQIRQMGTIGGNLASGSPIADSVPLHLVLDAELELASNQGVRRVPLRDFYLGYRKTALRDDELIIRVLTPIPQADERLKLYKISKRRDMDISTLTFAIWIKLANDLIQDARVVLGGVGPTVMRIKKTELALRGKPWSEETFRVAGKVARSEVTPWSDVRGSADYRATLTENLLVKSYFELSECVTP